MTEQITVTKRFRKKSTARQLQQALNDAAAATEADISVRKLVQVRLETLNKIAARQRFDKLSKLKQELTEARAEIESLKAELTAARTEIERLSTQRVSRLDVDAKLKQVEQQFYGTEEKHV